MTMRIRLIGCNRYTYGNKGEVFEKKDPHGNPLEYDVDDAKGSALLASYNDKGMPYFVVVDPNAPKARKPVPTPAEQPRRRAARVVHRSSVVSKGKDEPPPADTETEAERSPQEEDDLEGVEL